MNKQSFVIFLELSIFKSMEKILVVNNDLDTMNLLKKWLEKKAYHVEYTSNSDNVTNMVKDIRPRLVIVDVMQKDVVNEIKSDKEIKEVPILLMTGYTSKYRGKDVPFDDVIEKPFNLSILEKKIEKLVDMNVISH